MKKFNKSINLEYDIIEDQNGVFELNLRDLFKEYYYDLPYLVDTRRCIYLITNLVNEKVYVGQAKWLYGRSTYKGFSHLKELQDPYNDLVLQRALRKYKPKNFKVEVLESNCLDLNEREIFYIRKFNSCIYWEGSHGYNMNSGGGYCEHLHTPEVNERRRVTNIEWYGNAWGAAHTPEARAKAKETIALRYDGDPYGQIHTKESILNKIESDKANHGGVLAIHTEESRYYSSVSRVRNASIRRINSIIEEGKELTFENYLDSILDDHPWRRIETLLYYLPDILEYDLSKEEYEMYEIIYNYCISKYKEWTGKILNTNPFLKYQ